MSAYSKEKKSKVRVAGLSKSGEFSFSLVKCRLPLWDSLCSGRCMRISRLLGLQEA